MNVERTRFAAQFSVIGGVLTLHGVGVQEFASWSRAVPMISGLQTEILLSNNSLYRVFTGVKIAGVSSGLQLAVRPTLFAIRTFGCQVWRTDVINSEIVVLISVQSNYQFRSTHELFEVAQLGASEIQDVEHQPAEHPPIQRTSIAAQLAPPSSPDRRPSGLSDEEKQKRFMETEDDAPVAARPIQTTQHGGLAEGAAERVRPLS